MSLNMVDETTAKKPEYVRWHQWNPGLDNDQQSLQEVIDTMPAAPPDAIPWQVRLLENPTSLLAFKGAVSLQQHDYVHVLLGRGMLPNDEAFVIGFTMGSTGLSEWKMQLFTWMTGWFYPKPYPFDEEARKILLAGYFTGYLLCHQLAERDLSTFDFSEWMHRPLIDLRKHLGIVPSTLHASYRVEKMLFPEAKTSKRLDTDRYGVDPSYTVPVQGEPVKFEK